MASSAGQGRRGRGRGRTSREVRPVELNLATTWIQCRWMWSRGHVGGTLQIKITVRQQIKLYLVGAERAKKKRWSIKKGHSADARFATAP